MLNLGSRIMPWLMESVGKSQMLFGNDTAGDPLVVELDSAFILRCIAGGIWKDNEVEKQQKSLWYERQHCKDSPIEAWL
jgi:hypothetical protein